MSLEVYATFSFDCSIDACMHRRTSTDSYYKKRKRKEREPSLETKKIRQKKLVVFKRLFFPVPTPADHGRRRDRPRESVETPGTVHE